MAYSTGQVAAYFKRSEPTIRKWAVEFKKHFSATGAPEKGRTRLFSIEDMTIFDLIASMKDQNKTFEEIHASLDSGMRGEPPSLDEKDLQALQATEGERRLSIEVDQLQRVIMSLREQLNIAQSKIAQFDQANLKMARLETSLEHTKHDLEAKQGELDTAREQLKATQKEIVQLSQKLGEEYVRGVMDALQRMGQFPSEHGNNQ